MTHPDATAPALNIRAVVGFLIFCELASGFTQGFYSPLIPRIGEHAGVSDAQVTWFMTVQTLSAAVCVPLLSKLGDMFGHRRLLRIAMLSVFLGALLIALVPRFEVILVARVLQGPIAVWLPLEIAIIHGRISGEPARRGVGLLVAFLSGGFIAGNLCSGAVAKIAPSLAVTLLVPLLMLLVSLYAVFFRVPETPLRTPGRIDTVGFVGLALVMITLLTGLSLASSEGLHSPTPLIVLGAAGALLVAWVWWERHTESPAVDIGLVASWRAAPIHVSGFMFGLVMLGSQAPLTTFLSADPAKTGYGFGASSGSISLVIAAIGLMSTLGAGTFAALAHRLGPRMALVLAAAMALAANLFIAVLHSAMWQVWTFAVVSGYGMGVLLGGLPAFLAELTPAGQTGGSVGVYNALRSLGGAAGGAVFAVVLGIATVAGNTFAGEQGYTTMWLVCAGAFALAVVALVAARSATRTTIDQEVSA